MKIYKYPIHAGSIITLPEGANVLSAGEQEGTVFIWALVDPEKPLVERKFEIFATGFDEISNINDLYFINTVLMKSGLVWHVFEQFQFEEVGK